MKGFKEFILRGNVVDLAVAFVIGAVFAAVVTAFVADFVTPLIGALGGTADFSGKTFTINDSKFLYGDFIDKLLQFLVVSAVVYFFVVKPLTKLIDRLVPKKPVRPTRECPECLSDIAAPARRCAFCSAESAPQAA